jgi:hypothetical protein
MNDETPDILSTATGEASPQPDSVREDAPASAATATSASNSSATMCSA